MPFLLLLKWGTTPLSYIKGKQQGVYFTFENWTQSQLILFLNFYNEMSQILTSMQYYNLDYWKGKSILLHTRKLVSRVNGRKGECLQYNTILREQQSDLVDARGFINQTECQSFFQYRNDCCTFSLKISSGLFWFPWFLWRIAVIMINTKSL